MEKEIIILVYYINIGNMPSGDVEEYLYRVHENFDSIKWPEDTFVKTFLIPVSDQRTRIECIYPVNMNDKKTNKSFQALSKASEQLTLFVKDAVSTTNIKNQPKQNNGS